jgi:hypothetical protein
LRLFFIQIVPRAINSELATPLLLCQICGRPLAGLHNYLGRHVDIQGVRCVWLRLLHWLMAMQRRASYYKVMGGEKNTEVVIWIE